MAVILGCILVVAAVLTGYTMAGGKVAALIHISEIITICGASAGGLVIMSPKKVLGDLMRAVAVRQGDALQQAIVHATAGPFQRPLEDDSPRRPFVARFPPERSAPQCAVPALSEDQQQSSRHAIPQQGRFT